MARLRAENRSLSSRVDNAELQIQTVGGGTSPTFSAAEYFIGAATSSTNVNLSTWTALQIGASSGFDDPTIGEVSSGVFTFALSGYYRIDFRLAYQSRGTGRCIIEHALRVNGTEQTNRAFAISNRTDGTTGRPMQASGFVISDFDADDTLTVSAKGVGAGVGSANVFDYRQGGVPAGRIQVMYIRPSV